MKKVCRKIKLRKLKCEVSKELLEKEIGNESIVLYWDNTYKHCIHKDELYDVLEKDHIKRIRYVFDMTDRIIVDRDILIETDEVK